MTMEEVKPAPMSKMSIIEVMVIFFEEKTESWKLSVQTLGQTLFNLAVMKIGAFSSEYFGLAYLDVEGNQCWLDLSKPLFKVFRKFNRLTLEFVFSVKYYLSHPNLLRDDLTRYLFAQQIKRDFFRGLLHSNRNTSLLLAAFIVQAEFGDYKESGCKSYSYLKRHHLFRSAPDSYLMRLMELHQALIGLTKAEADYYLLDAARKVELYGARLHPCKDATDQTVNLAVTHTGILIFHNFQRLTTFNWSRIQKLCFKRRTFLIRLHASVKDPEGETVNFTFITPEGCKIFWRKCIEHHAFFRSLSEGANMYGDSLNPTAALHERLSRPRCQGSSLRLSLKQLRRSLSCDAAVNEGTKPTDVHVHEGNGTSNSDSTFLSQVVGRISSRLREIGSNSRILNRLHRRSTDQLSNTWKESEGPTTRKASTQRLGGDRHPTKPQQQQSPYSTALCGEGRAGRPSLGVRQHHSCSSLFPPNAGGSGTHRLLAEPGHGEPEHLQLLRLSFSSLIQDGDTEQSTPIRTRRWTLERIQNHAQRSPSNRRVHSTKMKRKGGAHTYVPRHFDGYFSQNSDTSLADGTGSDLEVTRHSQIFPQRPRLELTTQVVPRRMSQELRANCVSVPSLAMHNARSEIENHCMHQRRVSLPISSQQNSSWMFLMTSAPPSPPSSSISSISYHDISPTPVSWNGPSTSLCSPHHEEVSGITSSVELPLDVSKSIPSPNLLQFTGSSDLLNSSKLINAECILTKSPFLSTLATSSNEDGNHLYVNLSLFGQGTLIVDPLDASNRFNSIPLAAFDDESVLKSSQETGQSANSGGNQISDAEFTSQEMNLVPLSLSTTKFMTDSFILEPECCDMNAIPSQSHMTPDCTGPDKTEDPSHDHHPMGNDISSGPTVSVDGEASTDWQPKRADEKDTTTEYCDLDTQENSAVLSEESGLDSEASRGSEAPETLADVVSLGAISLVTGLSCYQVSSDDGAAESGEATDCKTTLSLPPVRTTVLSPTELFLTTTTTNNNNNNNNNENENGVERVLHQLGPPLPKVKSEATIYRRRFKSKAVADSVKLPNRPRVRVKRKRSRHKHKRSMFCDSLYQVSPNEVHSLRLMEHCLWGEKMFNRDLKLLKTYPAQVAEGLGYRAFVNWADNHLLPVLQPVLNQQSALKRKMFENMIAWVNHLGLGGRSYLQRNTAEHMSCSKTKRTRGKLLDRQAASTSSSLSDLVSCSVKQREAAKANSAEKVTPLYLGGLLNQQLGILEVYKTWVSQHCHQLILGSWLLLNTGQPPISREQAEEARRPEPSRSTWAALDKPAASALDPASLRRQLWMAMQSGRQNWPLTDDRQQLSARQSLFELLLAPGRHMRRYCVLLGNLLAGYSGEHPDLPDCKAVFSMLVQANRDVYPVYQELERTALLLYTAQYIDPLDRLVGQPRLAGDTGGASACCDGRWTLPASLQRTDTVQAPVARFERQLYRVGWLKKYTRMGLQPRIVLLLDDRLVYASRRRGPTSDLWLKVHGVISLQNVSVDIGMLTKTAESQPQWLPGRRFTTEPETDKEANCSIKAAAMFAIITTFTANLKGTSTSDGVNFGNSMPSLITRGESTGEITDMAESSHANRKVKFRKKIVFSAPTEAVRNAWVEDIINLIKENNAKQSSPTISATRYLPAGIYRVPFTEGASPTLVTYRQPAPSRQVTPSHCERPLSGYVYGNSDATTARSGLLNTCWHRRLSVASTHLLNTNDCHIFGYLLRQRRHSMDWQRLWTVLTSCSFSPELLFYVQPTDTHPLAHLTLLGCKAELRDAAGLAERLPTELPQANGADERLLQLTRGRKHRYRFLVDSQEAGVSWFYALSTVLLSSSSPVENEEMEDFPHNFCTNKSSGGIS